ncbi:hypothetical protein FGG79_19745 [Bacillus sp. BHET2]|uniref:hypothetical protein n=1 Tax=Bacillus sp. BHET2 TaxID=2583818 RepID=UPI00110F04ED|nr:hypothetical protein [Bacillus sp. BHET2]TMU83444.1 hypothetical protein FGG79_19745 [Bacillus sp. BHET2]
MKRLFIIIVILLLSGCSAASQKEEASQVPENPTTQQKKIEEDHLLKEDYTFTKFMEDHDVSLKGDEIPYKVEEEFVGKPIALEGSAQLSRYYNYGFKDLEGSHFVIKISKKDELDWSVYLPREKYPDLLKALKKGPVDIYTVASIPEEYFEPGQNHMGMAEEVLYRQSGVEEKQLSDDLAEYMNDHSVELTARDVLYDKKGMSDRPFALSGNAQLVTYAYASAYKDLEPTHFVLNVRDTVNSDEQLWSVAFERKKYSDLYEQALGGMVHVNLTAVMPSDRFSSRSGRTAIGQEVEVEPLERYVPESMQGQVYMEEMGLSVTGQEVLYDPFAHLGERFFVEGTVEFDPYATATEGYEDLQDTHFRIDIVEDPYGELDVGYPRALEGWTLYLNQEKYQHVYEQLSKEKYLEVMVTALMDADRYRAGQGGKAMVEDVVIK